MYAFHSNEVNKVLSTKRELNSFMLLYPNSIYKAVQTNEEARAFFNEHAIRYVNNGILNQQRTYGSRVKTAYFIAEYSIDPKTIYIGVDTHFIGACFLTKLPSEVTQQISPSSLSFKVECLGLDDTLISSHCIAISKVLSLLPECLPIEIKVPDESILISVTTDINGNRAARALRDQVAKRPGAVYFILRG